MAYCPLGRGWLTGSFRRLEDLPANDLRRMLPRFQPSVLESNFKLVEAIEKIAHRKNVTTAQIVLAWVKSRGAIPIPGTTSVKRAVENCVNVSLCEEELEEIRVILEKSPAEAA